MALNAPSETISNKEINSSKASIDNVIESALKNKRISESERQEILSSYTEYLS